MRTTPRQVVRPWLRHQRTLVTAAAVFVMLGAALGVGYWQGWFGDGPPAVPSGVRAVTEQPAAAGQSVVTLTPEKLQGAGVHVGRVERRDLQPLRTVPGSLGYDSSRHLVVQAPVACVVRKVYVEPGQVVQQGKELALLSSSEVGLARDEVTRHAAELAIVQRELQWAEDVAAHVEQLLSALDQQPPLKNVERQFAGKILGEYRDKLLSAYSKMLLAEVTMNSTVDLQAGTLSDRVVQQRQSELEVARAQFASSCETASFDAHQQRDRHKADVEHAERLLRVSQERLAALLGPDASPDAPLPSTGLNDFLLLAPRAGRVEERSTVAQARVAAGEALFVIADTSVLWVSAEIHERDWNALAVAPDQTLTLRVPALAERDFEARVRFVGAAVSDQTRAVPLVAEIDNAQQRLRPGMFAWVDVPLAAAEPRLVVPASAVMRHEELPFVFVVAGPHRYQRRDIQIGLESGGWVEVVAGLQEDEPIVDQGAFFLKSELLLERDEE